LLPILFEEQFVLFVLEVVEFVKVLVVQSVFMCAFGGFDQSFLDYWLWIRGLFWNNAVFAEYIVPGELLAMVYVFLMGSPLGLHTILCQR
jgi:hypothetical protein